MILDESAACLSNARNVRCALDPRISVGWTRIWMEMFGPVIWLSTVMLALSLRRLDLSTPLLLLLPPPPPDDRSAWEDDEIDRLEKDVKESYGVMPDFASLAPEVAAEVNLLV